MERCSNGESPLPHSLCLFFSHRCVSVRPQISVLDCKKGDLTELVALIWCFKSQGRPTMLCFAAALCKRIISNSPDKYEKSRSVLWSNKLPTNINWNPFRVTGSQKPTHLTVGWRPEQVVSLSHANLRTI